MVPVPNAYLPDFAADPRDALMKFGSQAQRARAPWFTQVKPITEFGPLPDPNAIGVPRVRSATPSTSGIYPLLTPLPVGEHTIYFTGTFDEFGTSIDTTYHVTITSKGG